MLHGIQPALTQIDALAHYYGDREQRMHDEGFATKLCYNEESRIPLQSVAKDRDSSRGSHARE
jgi:hypothetical protein